MSANFEVKTGPDLWSALDMDIDRFMNVPSMLTEAYKNIFLNQQNRPQVMTYFDDMVSNIFTGRIMEMIDAKSEGRPVIGTFCVYLPEEIV